RTGRRRQNNSENRMPKPESRDSCDMVAGHGRISFFLRFVFRISGFGFPSAFGLRVSSFISILLAIFSACSILPAQESPKPLVRVHAHNDYEHKRPLFDALEHGFCSVEADIYLVDGQLLVAHQRNQVKSERTLQKLYLEPLRERVSKNGGR